jgi:F-type H+-transporting ATPase subunit epsilon
MLHLRILTTDRTVFNYVADEITLPTEAGVIGVLANHTPLVTIIRPGKIVIKKDKDVMTYTTAGGVLEVRFGSQVIILATTIEQDATS